jgi:hypothetical protein
MKFIHGYYLDHYLQQFAVFDHLVGIVDFTYLLEFVSFDLNSSEIEGWIIATTATTTTTK